MRMILRAVDLLVGDGWITNAGAWLLAKNIRKFHASAHLSCALFQGTTKTEILDRRDFPGDMYSMIEGAMTWVRSKINVRYIITGSVNREERPELPLDAIREAVVNAVAHRRSRETEPAESVRHPPPKYQKPPPGAQDPSGPIMYLSALPTRSPQPAKGRPHP